MIMIDSTVVELSIISKFQTASYNVPKIGTRQYFSYMQSANEDMGSFTGKVAKVSQIYTRLLTTLKYLSKDKRDINSNKNDGVE